MSNPKAPRRLWIRGWRAAGVAVSLPFFVGAAVLAYRLIRPAQPPGYLTLAQVLGAGLVSFGLSLGILGATFALTSRSLYSRTLWAALTLFGWSHIVLGFAARGAVTRLASGDGASFLPFALPVILWACSVGLAVKAHGSEPEAPRGESTDTPQQPLSPP